ncbi:MAG: hypothetical protein ACLU5I_01515 [Alistipes finegoldii]
MTVYQEQVMPLSQKLAGFTAARPTRCARPWVRRSATC